MPTTTPFNNLITFSRGSNATVTGPNGLIQWAPNNLLTFSEQADNAAWGKSGVGATANTAVAPDGTQTADTITASAGASTHRLVGATSTLAAGFSCVHSVYVKAGTHNFIQIHDGASANYYANFNVLAGTVGDSANCTASITAVGSGWYRCSIAFTVAAANPIICVGLVTSASAARNESWTAAGTENVLLWGAQVEVGSTATTYNPTTVKNLLGFSEAFDNANWTKTGSTVVTGAQANPVNGLFNAQKMMEDTSNGVHRVFATPACSPNTTYTYSASVKAAGRTQVRLLETTLQGAVFDLTSGTVVSTDAGIIASIVAQANGWYRCRITATTGAAQTLFVTQIQTVSGGLNSYTGDGNSGVFIYGAQLSDSASLDPYVPTPGAAPSSTAYYGPRFDYDPVTRAPRGILIEEQRTNLLLRSEEFDNGAWGKGTGATVTANATTSPDGTADADKLVETATTGIHSAAQAATTTTSTAYTFSIYLKSAERSTCRLYIGNGNGTEAVMVDVDTTAGTLTTVSNAGTNWTNRATTISNAGNGWWRVTLSATNASLTSVTGLVYMANPAGTIAYTGDGTSGIFIYGAQLEAGAFATSYIPTIASTVTRSADVATITGQNFGQWFGQSEGCLVVEATTSGDILSSYSAAIVDTGVTNIIGTDIDSGGGYRLRVTAASVNQALIQVVNPTVANTTYKLAGAYRVNDFAASANGGAAGTDTSGTVPTGLSYLAIGSNSATGASSWNGHIRSIRYIPVRAADFQLQALTT